MRRSKAPSIRRAAKMGVSVAELDPAQSVSTPLEMEWGTSGAYKGFRPHKYNEGENPLKDKRIFLVLWRKQSNKKHKTWTGNGTLELTTTKATLKDETGKVMDVLTCFNRDKIQEGALLEIGNRDIEIQAELRTADECISQRREEIENWYRQQEESVGIVSAHNEPARKLPRLPNILRKPKRSSELKCDVITATAPPVKLDEYICMLTPAELQCQSMQLLAEYCEHLEKHQLCRREDIYEIAQLICDHPVLLQHFEEQQVVSQALLPHLPPWQEMGLYDSAKFEFVHLMLDDLVVAHGQNCAIVASDQSCLDIIKGYCQCWDIAYVEDSCQADSFNGTISQDAKEPKAALFIAGHLSHEHLNNCKYVILYNFSIRSEISHLLAADTRVYTLITAGCWEEWQFQQHLGLFNGSEQLMDILKHRVSPTHQLQGIGQNVLVDWQQWQPPFNEAFLQDIFVSVEIPSLCYVYSKQHEDHLAHF
ncbi:PREDICTED: uncharacterized protein LOC108621859 [Drosophila arizonae]|uniref:Uncharacterized protein LOC108621859 n=1 Tax=Drosophila arizonae TaxID=7263 RepID=A0ABM1Q634_DROAR|nr:PREDICTED: uncharacterized protein LOC108621859 [Drosophila arizonae]